MWELDCEESWALKNWCFWTVVLEKTLASPLDCKEIQPVHPKDQSWVFIGRTDVEAKTPTLWPPDAKRWLIWKDSDAGKDWRQEEKGTTEWDGWMASLTQWTWVWVDSGSWWWTGRPGVLQFMGSQRVRHAWATELNWTESKLSENVFSPFFWKQAASLKLPVFKPSVCSFERAILGKLADKDFGQAPWGPSYLLGTAGISLQAVWIVLLELFELFEKCSFTLEKNLWEMGS